VAKKARQRTNTPAPAPPTPTAWESMKRHPRIVAFALVAIAVAVALVYALGRSPHTGSTNQVSVPPIAPKLVSASALKAFAEVEGQVIYWVGPVAGDKYELTRTKTNDVFVRYLPPRVKAGTHGGKYLFVATYPLQGAFGALKSGANGTPLKVAGTKGAVAAVVPGSPTNVRVAFPDIDYQIEVYDPHKGKARELARSGAVAQVP
jgi:hypothetical protein